MNKITASPTIASQPDSLETNTFEVPLNNRSRSLLRLERIFRETNHHINIGTPSAHFFALKQLFLLLDFFERGDFKAELIKELDREIDRFARLDSNPEVDLSKLMVFISQLGQLSKWVNSQTGKIGHQLLRQEFLSNARNKLTQGNTCLSFDAPFVKLFLAMPIETRQEKLMGWLAAFKGIQTSVEVLLRLSRETSSFSTVRSEDGFYQQQMEKFEYQFLGIKLPAGIEIYPEVSSGPKRFSIHFKILTTELEAKQFDDSFDFELAKYS